MNPQAKKPGRVLRWAGVFALVVVCFLAGYLAGWALHGGDGDKGHEHTAGETAAGQKWYCSMDPQIIRDGPGKCPICGMDLVPMPSDIAAGGAARELVVSEAAAKLMEVETSAVEARRVTAEVRMVGKLDYDETRVKSISAWVPGRIDRLYVDFTGISVGKGDHMVYLYSPELIGAQAELLGSVRAAAGVRDGSSELVRKSAEATLKAVREKLRLLGLSASQIAEIESSGEAMAHLTIYSPIGGVVIQKHATEGMYVQTGTPIYTVADLSQLWVKLDAYESDLPWIRYGQEVEFTTEAYPGEVFKGRISFISPTLDAKTRTVKLRVNVDNAGGRLKPEMFVRAVVKSEVAGKGKVIAPEMAGKWICPMHPGVVRDAAGECEICEMDLVTVESLGYVTDANDAPTPLVIPSSAPLITGKRAVVYVRRPGTERPTFEGREIVLGPRAGDYYIVESGLHEGEQVVTKGAFKIDSALQIQAKPSMMNETGGGAPAAHEDMH